MFEYILARLKERSTWLGIVSLITVAGVALSPEQSEGIVNAGVAIAGLVAVFTNDVPKLPPAP